MRGPERMLPNTTHVRNHPPRSIRGTPPSSTMLVVGVGTDMVGALRQAAFESALQFVHKTSIPSAAAWLEEEKPSAVLVNLRTQAACDLFASLRKSPRWGHVPLIGLSSVPTEIAFAETFWSGGDDVVSPSDTEQLVARLRATQHCKERLDLPIIRPRVVVAGADSVFRVAAGRVLVGAGYDVEFALTGAEIVAAAHDPSVRLIVTFVELPEGSALSLIEGLRQEGCKTPFVVSVTPRLYARARSIAKEIGSLSLCDSFASPDDILFAANDLLLSPKKNRRLAPRLAYGTLVWVRAPGADKDVVGYTYNVSAKGMFIRTLYPFPPGQSAWIEIVPPRSKRRVRLSAQAMWHRPFGPLGPALSPPGTGFQITGGLPGEVELYEEGFHVLAESLCGEDPTPA